MRRVTALASLTLASIILVACLAGCTGYDIEQARICRAVLPALNDEGAAISVAAVAPNGESGSAVRVDYEVHRADGPSRRRAAVCRFAGRGLALERLDLTAVDSDGAPLSDIKLFILKHYWLGQPGLREMPDWNAPPLLRVPLRLAYFGQQLVNASVVSAIYALLAVAYALVYGLTGRINLAFGDLAVVGAYGAVLGVALAVASGIPALSVTLGCALFAALLVTVPAGWSAGRSVFRPLLGGPGQTILIATLGLAIAIQEFLRLTQGASERWLPPILNEPHRLAGAEGFAVVATTMQMLIIVTGLALGGLLLTAMRRTRFGRQWRAVADDPRAAALMGVDPAFVLAETFALASAFAAAIGAILVLHYGGVGFTTGLMLGLKALVASVVGGAGSIGGALLGGVLVGLVETLWSAYLDIAYRDVAVLALLVLTLVLRPGGILSR